MSYCHCLKINQPECFNRLLVLRLSFSLFNSLFSLIGASLGPAANPKRKSSHSRAINQDYYPNNCLKLYLGCSSLCSLNLPQCPLAEIKQSLNPSGHVSKQTAWIKAWNSWTRRSLIPLRQLKHITRKESRNILWVNKMEHPALSENKSTKKYQKKQLTPLSMSPFGIELFLRRAAFGCSDFLHIRQPHPHWVTSAPAHSDGLLPFLCLCSSCHVSYLRA